MGRWGTKSESRDPESHRVGPEPREGPLLEDRVATSPKGRHGSSGETEEADGGSRRRSGASADQRPCPFRSRPWTPPWGPSSNCAARALSREPHPRSRSTGSAHGPARPGRRQRPRPGGGGPAVPPCAAPRAEPRGLPATGRLRAECPFAVEGPRAAGWSLGTHRAAVSPRDPPQPASRSPGSCRAPAQGRWPPPPPHPAPTVATAPTAPDRAAAGAPLLPAPKPAFLRTTVRCGRPEPPHSPLTGRGSWGRGLERGGRWEFGDPAGCLEISVRSLSVS